MPANEFRTSPASRNADYSPPALLIDGKWIVDRESVDEVRNPSDGIALAPVPAATIADLDRALEAAARALAGWRYVPAEERAAVLRRAAANTRERVDSIAAVITLEQGKPFPDARNEVLRAATFLEWDADQLQRLYSRVVPGPAGVLQTVVREPIGVVAAFTPWNVPISAAGRKISGTIGAGCAVIIKPAGETPASTCLFAQCFIDAGLPNGVLQVVMGRASQISTHLLASPIVRAVTLTGSVEVGKTLMRLAAEGIKPSLMELGGHAPVLIDSDVDPIRAGRLAGETKFKMAGQLCVSPSRFLVHRSIYDDFVGTFAETAGRLVVGDGFADGVDVGPVMNQRRVAYMEELVADAVKRGARVAAGGERVSKQGCFFAPTVLADVPLDADVMNLEPFGPLAACVPVGDMDEALAIANSLEAGALAGYVFSNTIETAERLADALQCGSVSINNFVTPGANAPFGGYKESGIGREGGEETFDIYSTSKTVTRRMERI